MLRNKTPFKISNKGTQNSHLSTTSLGIVLRKVTSYGNSLLNCRLDMDILRSQLQLYAISFL